MILHFFQFDQSGIRMRKDIYLKNGTFHYTVSNNPSQTFCLFTVTNFNIPMTGGGEGSGCQPQQVFFKVSQEWEKLFLQTKLLLPVGLSLGHLSMKKNFRSDLPSWI